MDNDTPLRLERCADDGWRLQLSIKAMAALVLMVEREIAAGWNVNSDAGPPVRAAGLALAVLLRTRWTCPSTADRTWGRPQTGETRDESARESETDD